MSSPNPLVNLLSAMLIRAFNDLTDPVYAEEALAWFESAEDPVNPAPLSFVDVCESLGLDPARTLARAKTAINGERLAVNVRTLGGGDNRHYKKTGNG
jgi:hypothetical protein